jgi:hypothetical protein
MVNSYHFVTIKSEKKIKSELEGKIKEEKAKENKIKRSYS